ncbi:outer membrane beta-barrel protein [Capnocytophaga canimorsus]|uniref:outer membrane beta-barrel protein n=1 Tax=Capnocytophaga canimorsus TaxID=28188 RepID=UPI00058984A9|nr:outer membrane beta-barrel protein [Capnocytophaga canimorsus]CEN48029.1 conserved exported hypothetical protein [Capnocytophaga canimorsus]VEJ18791.1 Uncharacterised protein [Capnocytophaga canimorsus]
MKNIYLFLMLFLPWLVLAQNDKFTYGVKGGSAFSNLGTDSNGGSPRIKWTYFLGGFAEYRHNEKFAFQAELLYNRIRSNYRPPYDGRRRAYAYNKDIRLQSIVMPLSIKYYEGKSTAFVVGMNMGYIARATAQSDKITNFYGTHDSFGPITTQKQIITNNIKNTYLTAFIGLEHHFSNRIFIEARLHLFGSSISKDDEKRFTPIIDHFIGVGYKF